jgi:RNA polymerase sigma-70 factor (ECF subfamily)
MTPDEEQDARLVQELAGGSEQAFLALYRRRQGPVFRFALRMSSSRPVAEEVTQDAFMALVRDAASYDPARGSVASYLFGITRHLVFRHLRQRSHAPLDEVERPPVDTTPSALEGLARRQDIARVRRAIASLPAAYREVVLLCEIEGLQYADAAVTLGCPIGTIRSRLSRARALLAAKLRGEPLRRGTIATTEGLRCTS